MKRRPSRIESVISRRQALGALLAGGGVLFSAGCGPSAGGDPLKSVRSVVGTRLFGPNPPGRIAFVKGAEIWQWTKGSASRLAGGQAFADPAWSPDGSLLAAVVRGTNHSDLVVLSSTGTLLRQLTHDMSTVAVQDSAWARKPAWSPDGKRLAYISDRGKHDMSLWLIDPAGGQPEPLILEQPYSAGLDWPTWSPDGSEIAYTTFVNGASEIHRFNLKTHAATVVAKDPDGDFDPAWSPNGKFLAYAGRSSQDDDVFVVPLAGNNHAKLTSGGMYRAPTWSSRSDAIAYLGYNGQGFDLFVAWLSLDTVVSVSSTSKLTDGMNVAAESGLSWTSREEAA